MRKATCDTIFPGQQCLLATLHPRRLEQRQFVDSFDPYLAWLDIGRHEHPIAAHRLLGLRAQEADPGVIAAAAERVQAHLRQFAAGPHSEHSRRLMTEVDAAREQLLGRSSASARRAPSAEIPLPPPAAAPLWGEQQIQPPPPVPGGSAAPATAPLRPAAPAVPNPSASHPAVTAPTIKSPPAPAPQSTLASPALPRPTPPPGGSGHQNAPSAPAFQSPVAETGEAAAVMPVGTPLGQPIAMAPPPATPIQAPPEASTPVSGGSWIPQERSGRVGKSVAAAVEQGAMEPELTTKARRIRRSSRQQQSYALASFAVGGVCLLLLLIVLLIVALNR